MSHTPISIKDDYGNVYDFKIHQLYKENVDLLIKANKNDIDFKILISGNGMTRTGKTTLAVQTGTYIDPNYPHNWRNQTCFAGDRLIEMGNKLKKGQVLIYDEARETLNTATQLSKYCQSLLNFFSQCGSKNLYIIIVLPEFFELPKSITINQSIFLVNCMFKDGFTRGFADFFNYRQKKYLYIAGKKWFDYQAVKPNFQMTFTKFFPLDVQEYEKLKLSELERYRKENNKTPHKALFEKTRKRLINLVQFVMKKEDMTQEEVANIIDMDARGLRQFLKYKYKGGG
jgi:hypothetical protein